MSAPRICMDYDVGKTCMSCFSQHANTTTQLLNALQRQVDQLASGGWLGRGAQQFYAEMNGEVLPAVGRLITALEEACHSTHSIAQRFQAAEREAGALFVGGAGDFVLAAKTVGFAKIAAQQGEGGGGNLIPAI